jgi:3-hydroxybutyryl-CoA dehydrogenase
MVASKTTEDTFNKILAFARDIHLVVIPIHKEQPGYILNTLNPIIHVLSIVSTFAMSLTNNLSPA